MRIDLEADSTTDIIIRAIQAGRYRFRPSKLYDELINQLGERAYKLTHGGVLEWWQYECRCRYKIGKRNRKRILKAAKEATHDDLAT